MLSRELSSPKTSDMVEILRMPFQPRGPRRAGGSPFGLLRRHLKSLASQIADLLLASCKAHRSYYTLSQQAAPFLNSHL